MSIMKRNEQGFSHVMVVVVIVVLAVVGLAGWRVFTANQNSNKKTNSSSNSVSTSENASSTSEPATYVAWQWGGDKYITQGTPPSCPDPLKFSTPPADVTKATAVLYPGQVRGGNYKPHGGLRFDNNPDNNVTVKAIMDGYVVSGARYIETGETQYMFTLVNSCGIAYRYDHLLTLSPAMQALADTLPAAKPDDSRTTNFDSPKLIKEGEVIATAVGFQKTKNVGFDLGVYDYRQPNAASKNATFAAAQKQYSAQTFYAVCWLNMFASDVSAQLNALPAGDQKMGKTSDYCK